MTARRTAGGRVPDLVQPMQVSVGSGQPPTGPDWVVELAWTGHRCIAYVEPGRRVRLLSGNDVSMTAAYPELGPPLERHAPPRGMVLDGTLVARGEEHAPRARLLKRRSARFHPSEAHIRDVPVDFQVADLLWLDGHSTVELPYRDRRALLEGLGFDSAPVWTTSPMPVTELAAMLRIADAKGVDALHARHLGSRYRPGGRSPLWLKVPVPRVRHVVVGGWTPTDPAQPDTIASLLLGVPAGEGPAGEGPAGEGAAGEGAAGEGAAEGEGLRYVGRVGVAGEDRRRVGALRTLRRAGSPFVADGALPAGHARHASWVQPRLVGLVEFTGFAADGRLRLPRWLGPVDPGEVEELRWASPAVPPPHRTTALPPPAAPGHAPRPESPPVESPPAAAAQSPSAQSQSAQSQAVGSEAVGSAGSAPASPAVRSASDDPRSAAPTPDGPEGQAAGVEGRRLEQHFVYNALSTIASLIRTDPGRARELLFGFADLSRAADQPSDTATTLGHELDAVRGYLQLEQARFGRRLRVEWDVDPTLHPTPVEPLRLLAAVREVVQRDIEPREQGGVLTVSARPVDRGCAVTVVGGAGRPAVLVLQAADSARSG